MTRVHQNDVAPDVVKIRFSNGKLQQYSMLYSNSFPLIQLVDPVGRGMRLYREIQLSYHGLRGDISATFSINY